MRYLGDLPEWMQTRVEAERRAEYYGPSPFTPQVTPEALRAAAARGGYSPPPQYDPRTQTLIDQYGPQILRGGDPYGQVIAQEGRESEAHRQALADREAAYAAALAVGGLLPGSAPGVGGGVDYSEIEAALGGDLQGIAALREAAARAAGEQASSAYGGEIAAVNRQIKEQTERRDRDMGIVNGLIEGAQDIYQQVRQDAKKAGANAAKAIEANTEVAEKELAREHKGTEGKVRAIMDLVGAEGNEAVFTELTEELDETMGFIEQGFGVTAEGQSQLTSMAERMAVTAARATETTMVGEHGRTLDQVVDRFNKILKNLFSRRSSLYAARARAQETAEAEMFQSIGSQFPVSSDEFGDRIVEQYVEGSGLARGYAQEQAQMIMVEMGSLGIDSISDYLLMAGPEGSPDYMTLAAQVAPFEEVIQGGAHLWGQANERWYELNENPMLESFLGPRITTAETYQQGLASHAETIQAMNSEEIINLIQGLGTNPYAAVPGSYLGG